MPKRQVIRLAAIGLMMTSGGLFAVNAGLVPGMGQQAATDETTAPPQVAMAGLPVAPPSAPAAEPDMTEPAVIPAALTGEADTAVDDSALPDAPEFALTQPDLPQPGNLSDRMAATPDRPATAPDSTVSAFGLPCGLSVTASASAGAMVALDVMDPCQPGTQVIVEHSALTIAEMTDSVGLLTLDIPAFETPAFFTVRVGDAAETALVALPDFDGFDRVAVAWTDAGALELHAMEFGAAYGEPGHIWQDNAGTLQRALDGEGGVLTRLGSARADTPMMAEVYSFPRDTLAGRGAVRLSIEAPITAQNCGQDIAARTLETAPDGPVDVTELTFTLPGCDAVGDYLVLQNLLQDLRVASN